CCFRLLIESCSALLFFFFQAEDGIRGFHVTGVQTCALPILVGVLVVGILSLLTPELFPRDTVWSRFGSGYGYIPLVLPAVGLVWLWRSSPGRVARASAA